MKTALTVALNAAVDTTYELDAFAVGAIHTARGVERVAGGKGNNVARVLHSLGIAVTATGLAGGQAGGFIQAHLRQLGITAAFQPIAGESRTCLALIDRQGQPVTEVREPGPQVEPHELHQFTQNYASLVKKANVVILSGSLPRGVPVDYYAELISQTDAYVLLDTSGETLRAGLAAGPDLVKPNRAELENWVGHPLATESDLLAAVRQMRASGAKAVALSLGETGLLYDSPEGTWLLRPPKIQPLNPVGSGDALVAGIVAGLLNHKPLPEALRLGVACGAANAQTRAVASLESSEVDRLAPAVQILRR